jgi:hypothetical protein
VKNEQDRLANAVQTTDVALNGGLAIVDVDQHAGGDHKCVGAFGPLRQLGGGLGDRARRGWCRSG